jgi:hypothetical protein
MNSAPRKQIEEHVQALIARIEAAAIVAKQQPEEILWDVDGLMPSDDAPTNVFGPPGALKSWIALHLCHAIVAGLLFLGRYHVRKRPSALYINVDAGPKSFRNRIRRVSDVVGFDFLSICSAEFTLHVLRALMANYPGGFVVIDCWSAIYNPERSLDPGFAMKAFVDALRAIYTEFDCGGLVIDHPHRPKEVGALGDYSGSIQKEAGFRNMWHIVADPPVEGQPRNAKIICRKLSEGEAFAGVRAEIDFSNHRVSFTAPGSGDPEARENTLEAKIIEWAARQTNQFSKRSITDAIHGFRVADVRATTATLIERGVIVPTGAKRGGGDLYRLECVPAVRPDWCVPINRDTGRTQSDTPPMPSASGASECVPEPDAPVDSGEFFF